MAGVYPDVSSNDLTMPRPFDSNVIPRMRTFRKRHGCATRAQTVHMTYQSGGPIVGYAIVKALNRDQESRALDHDAAESRAALDEEELREVEYASMGLPVPARLTSPHPRRSLLHRIFRR